jgi:prophage antirepressor-like protein
MEVPMKHEHRTDKKVGARDGELSDREPAAAGPAVGQGIPQDNQSAGDKGWGSGETPPSRTREFSFDDRRVRTVLKDGQPWFVAKDVCAILEIVNPRDAIASLDDDEKGVAESYTIRGIQTLNVVSESGLFSLVFKSHKPQAKIFRRWVTGEVLPSIRNTGRYEREVEPVRYRSTAADPVQVMLPGHGRFVVVSSAGQTPHIHQTPATVVFQEIGEADCLILAHWLKVIEGLWHRVQHIGSGGVDPQGGFSITTLGETILQGGRISERYLHCYDQPQE